MKYTVNINQFDGPLDLLLHLIKKSDINIYDIKIEEITKQYLDFINAMQEMNLNVASEYLVMAAELIEIKSSHLLPKKEHVNDEEDIDPKENLINRLLEYQKYKEITSSLKLMEQERQKLLDKNPEKMDTYISDDNINSNINLDIDLIVNSFMNVLNRQKELKPLNTKITKKEYSVSKRSMEIRSILKVKKEAKLEELLEIFTKEYLITTFLSVLDLVKKEEINVIQDNNFESILLRLR